MMGEGALAHSTAKERVFPVRLDPENLTRSFAPFPRRVKQEIPSTDCSHRISFYCTPFPRVLFTFPSRYLYAIGH